MILVTGATGTVGSALMEVLTKQNIRFIAASRSAARKYEAAEHRVFDFTDPATYDALRGATRVFLVRPPRLSNVKRDIAPFLGACKAAGVEKIVFLSVVGAESLPIIPHAKIEKAIERLGVEYTFLRAGFFMQNLSTTHAEEIRERNELVLPCGRGKTSFVHARDIAEIAAAALHGRLREPAVTVVGDQALDYYQTVKMLRAATGRPVEYKPVSIPRFFWYRIRHGVPVRFALVMTGLYVPTRFGKAEVRGVDISGLLGRRPIRLETFIEESKQAWIPK
jgi:uncharacterized protein YbjT (DUF2867 family)